MKKSTPPCPDNLTEALKQSIDKNHSCQAIYLRSIWVEEMTVQGLWTGSIAIFEIRGHDKARIAYGWWEKNSPAGLVTILSLTSNPDPHKALQAYWMSQD